MMDEQMKNLETLIETQTAGVMLRSKARWVEHGKKYKILFKSWKTKLQQKKSLQN